MYSFLGLGNIGNNYAQTKHNAGFWVLDELSKDGRLILSQVMVTMSTLKKMVPMLF